MALRDQVVDIFLTGPDQLPPDHQGGQGRLTDLRNATIEHFDPATPAKPQFLNIKQRKGMRSLALTGHNIATGAATTPAWTGPRLLATTQSGAPYSICRSKPRVYDGTDWADYPDTRVVTNKTTARPVWSGQSVAQAPDKAWLNGVQCHTWTEVTQGSNVSSTSVMTVMAGFRADNGAWIRKPFAVQASTAPGDRVMSRASHDGTQFWIFATNNGATPQITMYCYDQNGKQLASNNVDMKWADAYTPGYWDIQRSGLGPSILLAQPNGDDPDADNNVIVTDCSYNGATITTTDYGMINVHCNGPVAWATNFQDSFNYLLTTNFDTGSTVRLWGYRIEFVIPDGYAATHEYNFNTTIADTPDTLIGFTEVSTDSTPAHKNLVVSAGLPAAASSYGAAFDPALRYMQSFRCTWADVHSFIRQSDSLAQVSRAFVIDDDYYAMTYYQSGSGYVEPEIVDVTVTAGDYMLGAAEQPIKVQAGDLFNGSPHTFLYGGTSDGNGVVTTLAIAPANIDDGGTPDSVIPFTAVGLVQVPDGTPVLKWTFKNLSGTNYATNSLLKVVGSSIPTANFQWEIIHCQSVTSNTIYYTRTTNQVGGTLSTTGNFVGSGGTGGTVEAVSVTAYTLPGFNDIYTGSLTDILLNGDITVTGNSTSGNNGSFTIYRTVPIGVTVITTTQSNSQTSYTAVVTPTNVNVLGFNGEVVNSFDDSYIGETLQIDNDILPPNNTVVQITEASNKTLTVDSTTMVPELVTGAHIPIVTVFLAADQNQYTFFLQDPGFDYSFINAIISVTGALHSPNNGLFRITQIVDGDTVITVPVSVVGIPRNELFGVDPSPTITIQKQPATAPQIQPQWFITPLGDVTTSQVGNLELGLAYADWRREGAATSIGAENPYLLHVTTPCIDNDGYTIDLPFRAVTVTEQSATVIGGQVSTNAVAAAVVGVKEFKLYSATFGQACDNLIPGPMAGSYDGGRFVESGILINMEQPTLQSEQVSDNDHALTPKATYSYVGCIEAIDGQGNRIWTAPSPALEVILTGDNNSATISGRLPIPLDSSGVSLASIFHYGLSNRPMLVLSLYRTCIQNGLQTTAHYKITDDLAPNALAPINSSNDSGFAFPDAFTWTYTDENLDSVVLSNEQLYTDRGFLPRFHPPAFHNGATGWQERDWLNAYDGAIWFSGQPSEGEAVWYNPLFRVPAPFEPTAVANLSSFLAGFALDSKWYLPQFRPPSNSGQLTNIPAWIRLDLEGGCTGLTLPVRGGVAYSSNFGGVWYLSSQLKDEWTSRDMIDSLDGRTVTALAVDSKQRLYVLTNTTDMFSFDQISRRWSRWLIGSATNVKLATISNGTLHIQNNACVSYYDTTLARDIIAGVETGTPLGFTMASLNFGNVAGVKKVRLFQLRGQYKDTHKLQVAISYPDQNATSPTTTMQLFTPSASKPYVLDFYPKTEEASSYSLVVDASFSGVTTPGNSFEMDMLAAQVAVDGRAGINKSTQQISNG